MDSVSAEVFWIELRGRIRLLATAVSIALVALGGIRLFAASGMLSADVTQQIKRLFDLLWLLDSISWMGLLIAGLLLYAVIAWITY